MGRGTSGPPGHVPMLHPAGPRGPRERPLAPQCDPRHRRRYPTAIIWMLHKRGAFEGQSARTLGVGGPAVFTP